MFTVQLTQGLAALVDVADAALVSQYKWHVTRHQGKLHVLTHKPGSGKKHQKRLTMGRVILGLTDRDVYIDFIDDDPLNNRRANLRPKDRAQCAARCKKMLKRCTSAYKGVSWHRQRGRWRAQIVVDGAPRHLGLFSDELRAAEAYNEAAIAAYGQFARLNVIEAPRCPAPLAATPRAPRTSCGAATTAMNTHSRDARPDGNATGSTTSTSETPPPSSSTTRRSGNERVGES
ncbi:MAG TPA: AP2 domain-containing protein [Tepidisphaeraceae bacterium]|jgi:hypothetical protein|nr:AP2 domain-containing protein [Tepidisphaeraceae bacterium]